MRFPDGCRVVTLKASPRPGAPSPVPAVSESSATNGAKSGKPETEKLLSLHFSYNDVAMRSKMISPGNALRFFVDADSMTTVAQTTLGDSTYPARKATPKSTISNIKQQMNQHYDNINLQTNINMGTWNGNDNKERPPKYSKQEMRRSHVHPQGPNAAQRCFASGQQSNASRHRFHHKPGVKNTITISKHYIMIDVKESLMYLKNN